MLVIASQATQARGPGARRARWRERLGNKTKPPLAKVCLMTTSSRPWAWAAEAVSTAAGTVEPFDAGARPRPR